MELILCLSIAILIVTARTSGQWSASLGAGVPSPSFRAKTTFAIAQFMSFACAAFALGLLDGFLTLELSGNRNAGIPLLIAVMAPTVGVVLWGAVLGLRIWMSSEVSGLRTLERFSERLTPAAGSCQDRSQ